MSRITIRVNETQATTVMNFLRGQGIAFSFLPDTEIPVQEPVKSNFVSRYPGQGPRRVHKGVKKGEPNAKKFITEEIAKLPSDTFTIGDLKKAVVSAGWKETTISPTLTSLVREGLLTRKVIHGKGGKFSLSTKVFAKAGLLIAPVEQGAEK